MKFVINKIIVPSVLVFFSLVFCLVAGEIVVRKLNLIPTTSIKVKELSPSKLSYLPNSSWQYSEPEFTENVQINSIGYRDYEPQFESPSILFLGDSQTYGTGVQLGERASDIVAKHIESHCEFGKSNVLNISMPGSSTKKELMMLEEALSKGLKISHIFLMVVSNDHSQNYYEDRDAQFKLGNQVVGERKQVGLKTKIVKKLRSLRYESHLMVAALKAVSEVKFLRQLYAESKVMGGWGEILDTEILYYENDKIYPQVQATKKYIELIAQYAPTTVVMVPDRYRFDPSLQTLVTHTLLNRDVPLSKINYDTEGEVLRDVVSPLNVDFIDPIELFREVDNKESLYYPINGHLTSKGQSLLAYGIARESRLINKICPSISLDAFDFEGDVVPDDRILVMNE